MRRNLAKTDVPTKIIKENADIFAGFIHSAINASYQQKRVSIFFKTRGFDKKDRLKKLKTKLPANKYLKKHL